MTISFRIVQMDEHDDVKPFLLKPLYTEQSVESGDGTDFAVWMRGDVVRAAVASGAHPALAGRLPDVGDVFWVRLKCCGVDKHDDIEPIFARLADAPGAMFGVHRDALGVSPVDARRQLLEREAVLLSKALADIRSQLDGQS